MKFSKQFEEDYNFYLNNKDKYTFSGKDIESTYFIEQNLNGKSAKECFYRADTFGEKSIICNNKQELIDVLNTKASINLHIKMYAESWAEFLLTKEEILEISNSINAPKWFFDSIQNQMYKIIKQKLNKDKYNFYAIIDSMENE